MKKILVVLFTIFCSTNIIAQILGDGGKNDSIAVQDTIVLPLNLPDEYRRLLEDRRSDNINSDYETMKRMFPRQEVLLIKYRLKSRKE